MNVWSRIKRFYYEKFGYSDELVELVASSQILKLCASGCSNKQIADVLQLDIDIVVDELEKWLLFSGWEEPQEVNALAMWRKIENETATIAEATAVIDSLVTTRVICARYLAIEEHIMKEWK